MSSIKTFVIKMRCRAKVDLKKSELSMMPVPDKDAIIIALLIWVASKTISTPL